MTARLAGVVAGPLFVGIALAQMLTRPGFDPLRHPVSLLANGAGGWIQVVNFIVTGLLVLAFAVAVRRQLAAGAARAWAPILLATCGMGLVVGGLFRADPALGFPIGTPDEVPATMSVPGAIHAAAPPLAFTALVAAIAVLAARMWRDGQRTTAVFSWVVAVVTFALSLPVWPSVVTIFVAIIVGFGWLTAYAVELSRSASAQAP